MVRQDNPNPIGSPKRPSKPTAAQVDFDARLAEAVAEFGHAIAPRLRMRVGDPEDQLRGPLERLLRQVGETLGISLTMHGETRLLQLAVRPDYAVDVAEARVGYIELKAPGKGSDPNKWSHKSHDWRQWEKLKALPNTLYTDGKEWSLFRHGKLVGNTARLEGDLGTAGRHLRPADEGLARTLTDFLLWEPERPRTIRALVRSVAGLCRLLRDEVQDILERERSNDDITFNLLAEDWRELLFPDLDDARFADAYAQTVTFSLLLARVNGIVFDDRELPDIARQLGKQHTLMGKALAILTEDTAERGSVVLKTLQRVIGVVDWDHLNLQEGDSYSLLYETFLNEYDPSLRKRSGSYYTPRPVARFMVRFVDEVLRTRLGVEWGLADDDVIVVDPAMGTGTFLTEIIHSVAETTQRESGSPEARIRELFERRLIGFERQVCPYSVAELKTHQALRAYDVDIPEKDVRFLTDTFEEPDRQALHFGRVYKVFQEARREADDIKRRTPVMVVIGNPPYRERAHGSAPWVERRRTSEHAADIQERPSLDEFRAPGNGQLEYVLSNLYVYFWRWATWKVFDAHPESSAGVVAFITTSAYLTGPGFAGMREYLRRTADEGWIIDLSPEGHQPPVNTRIFPGVQHPLCIAVFVRSGKKTSDTPARIHFCTIPGTQKEKFDKLDQLKVPSASRRSCPDGWQDVLASRNYASIWPTMPALKSLFPWTSPGVKPNRTWVYAPDVETLQRRWLRLICAPERDKAHLFKETDGSTISRLQPPLHGFPLKRQPIRDEEQRTPFTTQISYRSFDVQWIISDSRLIDRPRTDLWRINGEDQIFMTEQHSQPINDGPGLAFSAHIPDMHHFDGRGGRAYPLIRDTSTGTPNIAPGLLEHLARLLNKRISARDLLFYVAALVAHPSYTHRFRDELKLSGVHIPLSTNADLWHRAITLGREVVWLHTYGEEGHEPDDDTFPKAPRRFLQHDHPMVKHPISANTNEIPQEINYDARSRMLYVGTGIISPVSKAVWDYRVGGVRIVKKWFGYRKRRPAGRRSSPLDDINPERWEDATTVQLLRLLDVLTRLVALEPRQAKLLDDVCDGPLITTRELEQANVLPAPASWRRPPRPPKPGQLTIDP